MVNCLVVYLILMMITQLVLMRVLISSYGCFDGYNEVNPETNLDSMMGLHWDMLVSGTRT